MLKISKLLTSNVRQTIKRLSKPLRDYVAIAMLPQEIAACGLPRCDGYIVVRSISELLANLSPGMVLSGTALNDPTEYPLHLEVIEWSALPAASSNSNLTDYGVGRGFWVSALHHAEQGNPLHPKLTEDVILSYLGSQA